VRATQTQSVVLTLPDISLEDAADHLLDAVWSVAVSEGPFQTRLQTTRGEVPEDTTSGDDGAPETGAAVDELIALAVQTAVTASQAPPDVRLAIFGDPT
jgi:hypothetical protein